MKIAIVILNWNGKELLKRFLPSVVSYSEEAQIYVADNASTDDSIAYVKQNFPLIKIIQNTENGGYAKGYNDALQHINEEIFILLNNDVEVSKDWLKPLLEHFSNHPKTGALQPKILSIQNKKKFDYAGASGGFIDRLGFPYCRGRIFNTIENDEGQYNDAKPIKWASGACLVITKEAFELAEGFDEDYFAHQEEIDLCWRLHHLGFQIWTVPCSKVFHLGGGTLNALHPKKTFLNFRNSLFNLVKNLPALISISAIFSRLVLDGAAAFYFLFSGKPKHFASVFKAHLSFYMYLPKMVSKRKKHPIKPNFANRNSIVFDYFIQKKEKYTDL